MKAPAMGRFTFRFLTITAALAFGCIPPSGGGTGGGGSGGNGNGIGSGETGGFQENGLEAPGIQLVTGDNLPPNGDLLSPIDGQAVPRGDLSFIWEAADANGTNVDSTLFIKDQADVFTDPLFTTGIRTAPDETEHRLSIRFPDAGTFYWGVEITDGRNTIRRPATETGEMFVVSEDLISRGDAAGVVLLCPRATQPALPNTTFSWSLGDTIPTRTQVYVGRAGTGLPFDSPLRVIDVSPANAESRTLSQEEALPIGEELSWGLRIETADEVLFTFEGQAGESFLVADNIPPSGVLSGPDDGSILADNTTSLTLAWAADSGNCEDEVQSTVYFEFLDSSETPSMLFDSPIHLSIPVGVFQTDLVTAIDDLNITAGTWAWGVLADDGTDQTQLPHSQLPDRTFRTFFRNTAPRFIADPLGGFTCDGVPVTSDFLGFSYADDNGVDTVTVTITFAIDEAALFDSPEATLTLPAAPAGELTRSEIVFLESGSGEDCPEFIHGAGFYGVELDDGINDPAQSIVEYAGPPTGACCHDDSSCTEVIEEDCVASAGAYQGDDTLCALTDCSNAPPPIVDCNGNGVADSDDISNQTSLDCNLNGVPDECEGSPTVVEAGFLATGIVDPLSGGYDSTANGNDLSGSICPPDSEPNVEWRLESAPSGSEVSIRDPASLTTGFDINPGVEGDYVFSLTLLGSGETDTVTFSLLKAS